MLISVCHSTSMVENSTIPPPPTKQMINVTFESVSESASSMSLGQWIIQVNTFDPVSTLLSVLTSKKLFILLSNPVFLLLYYLLKD